MTRALALFFREMIAIKKENIMRDKIKRFLKSCPEAYFILLTFGLCSEKLGHFGVVIGCLLITIYILINRKYQRLNEQISDAHILINTLIDKHKKAKLHLDHIESQLKDAESERLKIAEMTSILSDDLDNVLHLTHITWTKALLGSEQSFEAEYRKHSSKGKRHA